MTPKAKNTYIYVSAAVLITVALALFFLLRKPASREAGIPEPTIGETRRLTIVFAGDLMQHQPQVEAARQPDGTFDYTDCFRHIAPLFNEAGLVIVNLETTLSEEGPYTGYPMFRSPAQLAGAMKTAGIDVALLANNHICDKGSKGIGSTVDAVEKAGLLYTGAFADSAGYASNHPLTLEKEGFRISLLNYTYGTNGLPVPEGRVVNLIDTAIIARDMAAIERTEDHIVIACVHWGIEYRILQNKEQQSLAGWLHDRGVDIIIGGHPHVVQPAVTALDTTGVIKYVTSYSLGNFVSNQTQPGTDGGLVVRLTLEKDGDGLTRILPPENLYAWTHRPVIDGKRRYSIIPSFLADSLLANDAAALSRYESFVAAARKAMEGSGFTEIIRGVNE